MKRVDLREGKEMVGQDKPFGWNQDTRNSSLYWHPGNYRLKGTPGQLRGTGQGYHWDTARTGLSQDTVYWSCLAGRACFQDMDSDYRWGTARSAIVEGKDTDGAVVPLTLGRSDMLEEQFGTSAHWADCSAVPDP